MGSDYASRTILSDFTIYATEQKLYVVAAANKPGDPNVNWHLLKFERSFDELLVTEDAACYSRAEIDDILSTLRHGNPGFRVVAEHCPALIGCFKLSGSFYLLLVTRSRSVGTLCGAEVRGIDATALLPLTPPPPPGARPPPLSHEESQGRRLLSLVSLTRDFFYSPSWPLWTSLQKAMDGPEDTLVSEDPFANDRVWNAWLTHALRGALDGESHCQWVTPLIHGAFEQRKVALHGSPITLTLMARRSRYNAGTRYLRRGINHDGCVANDCEIEQIVECCSGSAIGGTEYAPRPPVSVSSVVQLRGSVPLFWAQDWTQGLPTDPGLGQLRPAPIRLLGFDPLYEATAKHFEDLRQRYGVPIICLDLLRKTDRKRQESALSKAYAGAIASLNRDTHSHPFTSASKLRYVSFDMRAAQRGTASGNNGGGGILTQLHRVQERLLAATGIFATTAVRRIRDLDQQGLDEPGVAGARRMRIDSVQQGVLRTNCVDCIDRTNVAQFAFGLLALGQQLHVLGLTDAPRVAPESSLAAELMSSWEAVGHMLAEQYAGSEAHAGFFQRARGEWQAARQSHNILTSMRRLYSTRVTDEDKQNAINLFLGSGYMSFPAGAGVGVGGSSSSGAHTPMGGSSPHASPLGSPIALSRRGSHAALERGTAEVPATKANAASEEEGEECKGMRPSLSRASMSSSVGEGSVCEEITLPELLFASNPVQENAEAGGVNHAAGADASGDRTEAAARGNSAVIVSSVDHRPPAPEDGEKAAVAGAHQRQDDEREPALRKQTSAPLRLRGFPWRWWTPSSPQRPRPASAGGARASLESLDNVMPRLRVVQASIAPTKAATSPWLVASRPSQMGNGSNGTMHRGQRRDSPPPPQLPPRLVRSSSAGAVEISGLMERQMSRQGSGVLAPLNIPASSDPVTQHQHSNPIDITGRLLLLDPDGNPFNSPPPSSPVLPRGSGGHYTLASLDLAGVGGPFPTQRAAVVPGSSSAYGQGGRTTSSSGHPAQGPSSGGKFSWANFSSLRTLVGGVGSSGGSISGEGSQPFCTGSNFTNARGQSQGLTRAPSQQMQKNIDVVRQHQALAHGLDDLGLPASVAPLWRQSANVLGAFNAAMSKAEEEQRAMLTKVAIPLTPVEFAAAQRDVSKAVRPTLALTVSVGPRNP
jgi:phosphatidylinositol 3,5-bisphosphate 5-phosphatase